MKPLVKTGILAFGSIIGNRAIRAAEGGNPEFFNMLTSIFGYRRIKAKGLENPKKISQLPFDMKDFLAIGVGTIVPLLISNLIKVPQVKNLDVFHFGTSIIFSSVITACFASNKK